MGTLLVGQKLTSVALFARGAVGAEQEWRNNHPDFKGGWRERWKMATDFYEETHNDPVNRWMHIIGIPMIAGGAAGLLAFRPLGPLWFASASSFTAGWGLNLIGHGFFEKKAPALTEDPLSFIAGPVWDMKQMMAMNPLKRKKAKAPAKAKKSRGRKKVAKGNGIDVEAAEAVPVGA